MLKLKLYALHVLAAASAATFCFLLLSWMAGWKWDRYVILPVPNVIARRPGTELAFYASNESAGVGLRRFDNFSDSEKERILLAHGSGDHKHAWLRFGYEYGEVCFRETVVARQIGTSLDNQ